MSDHNRLYVGDHVTDRDDPDATMLVVNLDTLRADAYELEDGGPTVADVNPDYPESDDVVEVVFPTRTSIDLDGLERYGYPRSRLQRVAPIHDVDDGDTDPEGGAPLWRVEDQLTAAREAAQGAETPANRERVLTKIDEARALLTASGLQAALDEEIQ